MNPVWVDEQGNEKEMNEHGVHNENAHTVGEQMDVQTAKGVLVQSLCAGTCKRKSPSTTDIVREKATPQFNWITCFLGVTVTLRC